MERSFNEDQIEQEIQTAELGLKSAFATFFVDVRVPISGLTATDL